MLNLKEYYSDLKYVKTHNVKTGKMIKRKVGKRKNPYFYLNK